MCIDLGEIVFKKKQKQKTLISIFLVKFYSNTAICVNLKCLEHIMDYQILNGIFTNVNEWKSLAW